MILRVAVRSASNRHGPAPGAGAAAASLARCRRRPIPRSGGPHSSGPAAATVHIFTPPPRTGQMAAEPEDQGAIPSVPRPHPLSSGSDLEQCQAARTERVRLSLSPACAGEPSCSQGRTEPLWPLRSCPAGTVHTFCAGRASATRLGAQHGPLAIEGLRRGMSHISIPSESPQAFYGPRRRPLGLPGGGRGRPLGLALGQVPTGRPAAQSCWHPAPLQILSLFPGKLPVWLWICPPPPTPGSIYWRSAACPGVCHRQHHPAPARPPISHWVL